MTHWYLERYRVTGRGGQGSRPAWLSVEPQAGDGALEAVPLLYVTSGHLWGVAGLFFGLWLIPMGALVVRSRWLPLPLGWILIAGGVGYLVSALVSYAFPNADLVTQLLTVPVTIGEIWIMGYLIIFGIRDHSRPDRKSARVP